MARQQRRQTHNRLLISDGISADYVFECFDDEDALNFHYAQDYTASVFKEYENWLSAPVEVTKMFATSPVSWKQFHD